jgi:hypothetical protein
MEWKVGKRDFWDHSPNRKNFGFSVKGNTLMKRIILVAVCLLTAAVLAAHPHFRKTLTVELPGGAEAVLSYQTTPANLTLAEEAQTGVLIVPRRPSLTLSADLTAGGVTIPAGEYTIGVIKNGEKDWTMALYPGMLGRRQEPDMSKVIRLDSEFSDSQGAANHMLLDINAGEGSFEGRAVLTMHFGTLFLSAALN